MEVFMSKSGITQDLDDASATWISAETECRR